MCNSEDFDIDEFDEDFLKDVSEKEELYYSQITSTSSHNEAPCKRRKLTSPPPPERSHPLEPVSTRKNLILDIFCNEKSQNSSQTTSKSCSNFPSPNSAASPKKSPEAIQNHQRFPETPKNTKAFPKQLGKSLELEVLSTTSKASKNSPSIISRPSNTFKIPYKAHHNTTSHKILESNKMQSSFSPGKRQIPVDLQRTLVRKFPGPAGLIPDNVDPLSSPEALHYLRLFDENDTNVTSTSPEERRAEFCTQDTKNLFLQGAWRNMLNDLPENFLDGYDIASIKNSHAKTIPRLAVVIQQIDQASENLRINLRDISDSIEGIMHSDLALNHPNILYSGVVLLLQDVGLLSFKVSPFCTTKVIFFSLDSLIAVYSEQGTLVKTPHLEAILRGDYEEMRAKMKTRHACSNKIQCIENSKSRKLENVSKKPNIDKTMQSGKVSEKLDDEFCDGDFNFEDDIFNQIDVTEFGDVRIDDNNHDRENEKNEAKTFETIAVIEKEPEEEVTLKSRERIDEKKESRNSVKEMSSGFVDDLLNDSDSDDEYLSQIDIDAISRTPSFNN